MLDLSPKKLFAVDPWYLASNSWDWASEDKSTINALIKILTTYQREINNGVFIPRVDYSINFMENMPDNFFDIVYLDTTHSYNQTKKEIDAILPKLKVTGFLIFDDYRSDPNHNHHGVFKAANEAVKDSKLKIVEEYLDVAQMVSKRI